MRSFAPSQWTRGARGRTLAGAPSRSAAGRKGFYALCLAASVLAGCGRPATEADCQLIVDRIVELVLRENNVTDPAEIQRRRNEVFGMGVDANKKAWLEGCVGRQITDKALACVRNAKTSAEITDECLR